MKVKLFDKSNIDQIVWPKSDAGRFAKKYLFPLIEDGVSKYIANVDTQLHVLTLDDLVLPVTVNDKQFTNSYVCSPYTHYITYAKEELRELNNKLLETILSGFLTILGKLIKRTEINKVVIVNNWLLSTNLYPVLTFTQIHQITAALTKRFPDHAILFRSVHVYKDNALAYTLRRSKYSLIGSRQVFFWNPKNNSFSHLAKKNVKIDKKLLLHTEYTVLDNKKVYTSDITQIKGLYDDLYLKKYSYNNPQFTKHFFKLVIRNNLMKIKVLKKHSIDGMVIYFTLHGMLTTPMIGYDTSFPKEKGLYRLLSIITYRDAIEKNVIAHESSGAAMFKKNRGCEPCIEYTAVYNDHLSFYRRSGWMLLEFLINTIGIPLIKSTV